MDRRYRCRSRRTKWRVSVRCAGTARVDLDPEVGVQPLLEELWSESTHFAFVRHCEARIDDAGAHAPTRSLRRIAAAVHPFRERLEDALWVREWPGTTSWENEVLWVRARAGGTCPFPLEADTLWSGWDEWDDLQLFDRGALKLCVCSHEGFGVAWGPERGRDVGVTPVLRPGLRRQA